MRNSCSAMISDEKRWTNIMTNMFLTNQWETLSEQLLSTSYIFEPWLQNIFFRWIERLYFDQILALFWLYLNYIIFDYILIKTSLYFGTLAAKYLFQMNWKILFWLYFGFILVIFWKESEWNLMASTILLLFLVCW